MGFNIESLGLSTAPAIVAAIAGGAGLVLIIVIVLCCCWCCRRNDREKRKRTNNNVSAENPPGAARGNQHVEPAQQRQQQNNPPRMAEYHKTPDRSPPPAQPPLQQPPKYSPAEQDRNPNHFPHPPESPLKHPPKRPPAHNKPSQSSTESTGSNSLPPPQHSRRSPTPQYPPAYNPRSGKSSLSGSEISSIPPSSPTLSYASSQTMFTYNDLAMATNGFSKANLLGQGGFGFVHKGVLPNGKEIAVKSLRTSSEQGEREFESEVEIISRVHHRHLVSLVGYCSTGSHRLLVYEFVPNKTLEFHLHDEEQPTMDWATRMKVAIGSAKGLAYLHEDCQPRIIHRDIKAANILLDNKFQAKVADFGLAKITPEEATHVSTRIMGSLGYLAPEYASSGRVTEKSDVYSFGVMLLELITGRKPVDRTQKEYNIVEWSRPLLTTALEDENFNLLVDPRLQFSYKHSEMARMVACAATCVRKSARRRPQMSQVVRALEGNLTINELNEGITPGQSFIQGDDTASEHSGSQYSGSQYKGDLYTLGFDSKNMGPSTTSEYGGTTTSDYGLYASCSSSEDQTTRELDSEEVQRERRRFKQRFLDSSTIRTG